MAEPKDDKKTKKDPFKTRKVKSEATPEAGALNPPPDVAEAIDRFRDCQDQAKHFEGEATVYKDKIQNWALDELVSRTYNGQSGSFKILGDETMVTFVTMDSSAGLSDEDVEQIRERWGDDAAKDLVDRDFRSIRFDPKVLAANYDQVVDALQALPEDVLENLFKPMLMKAKPGASEGAKKYAKDQDDYKELIRMLKMKNYIR